MAAVRSINFGRAPSLSGGPVTLFTVPPAKVAVVKCISIVWGDIVASGLDAWVQAQDLTKFARYAWAFTLATPTNFGGVFIGWGAWTLDSGEEIQAQCVAGTCDIQASGYLLDL